MVSRFVTNLLYRVVTGAHLRDANLGGQMSKILSKQINYNLDSVMRMNLQEHRHSVLHFGSVS